MNGIEGFQRRLRNGLPEPRQGLDDGVQGRGEGMDQLVGCRGWRRLAGREAAQQG